MEHQPSWVIQCQIHPCRTIEILFNLYLEGYEGSYRSQGYKSEIKTNSATGVRTRSLETAVHHFRHYIPRIPQVGSVFDWPHVKPECDTWLFYCRVENCAQMKIHAWLSKKILSSVGIFPDAKPWTQLSNTGIAGGETAPYHPPIKSAFQNKGKSLISVTWDELSLNFPGIQIPLSTCNL